MNENLLIKKSISSSDFAEKLHLKVLCCEEEAIELITRNVNRPGLQLTGLWKFFDSQRIQIVGPSEIEYLKSLSEGKMEKTIKDFFQKKFPCIIFSRGIEVDKRFIQYGKEYKIPVFGSNMVTSELYNAVSDFLKEYLAKEEQIHGVLMDVNGVGVLIKGNSGIGKSEIALELVSRGHRLACDDAVVVRRVDETLIGYAPRIVRHFMEVRGIGIIDVAALFGAEAVKLEQQIELVIEIEKWNEKKDYERVGESVEFDSILGVDLVKMVIPMSPGRNLAVIIETAASVYRQRMMGFIAAKELERRVSKK